MIKYKQRCYKCKKNFVPVISNQKYVACYNCQKNELNQEIKNSKMKKLFDIPEEFYRENVFLRDIKINYLRYHNLSERQIEAFKNTVERMKKKE